ncbi:uncharacterized protein LOC134851342 isoform X2 [Symsagittifera roscoffensis]
MSSSTNIVVGLACIFIDLGVLTLTALALGGGTWIEEVREQGDFFTRAQNSYHDMAMFSNNMDLTSIGMWRYFTQPGVSFPLPFRDPEILAGTFAFIGSLLCGCAAVVMLSFQIMGVHSNSAALSLTILWSFFFQSSLLLVGDSVVLYYFQSTFEYESLGHSHHEGWVAFSLSLLNITAACFRLYTATQAIQSPLDTMEVRSEYMDAARAVELARRNSYNGATFRVLQSPPTSGTHNSNSSNMGANYRWSDIDLLHHRMSEKRYLQNA